MIESPSLQLPPSRARSPKDCGAACVVALLNQADSRHRLSDLLAVAPISQQGHSIADLEAMFRAFGASWVGIRVQAEQLARVPMPFIAHLKFGHFVIVTAVNADRISLVDPDHGSVEMDRDDFVSAFSGAALTKAFSPRATPAGGE